MPKELLVCINNNLERPPRVRVDTPFRGPKKEVEKNKAKSAMVRCGDCRSGCPLWEYTKS